MVLVKLDIDVVAELPNFLKALIAVVLDAVLVADVGVLTKIS